MAKWQPGQSGNPAGRRSRTTEERYLRATISQVSVADWREIVDRAVLQAKKGDHRARQWLSDYIIGKPAQAVELSGKDGDSIRIVMDA